MYRVTSVYRFTSLCHTSTTVQQPHKATAGNMAEESKETQEVMMAEKTRTGLNKLQSNLTSSTIAGPGEPIRLLCAALIATTEDLTTLFYNLQDHWIIGLMKVVF